MFSDRNRIIAMALAATLALGGTTAATAKDKTPKTDPATLTSTGEARNCISSMNVNTVPAGDKFIMFRESANRWYRNELRNTCNALRPQTVMVFRNQTNGSQYCEMDSFEVVDSMTRSSFGLCTLGKFEPVEVPKGTKF